MGASANTLWRTEVGASDVGWYRVRVRDASLDEVVSDAGHLQLVPPNTIGEVGKVTFSPVTHSVRVPLARRYSQAPVVIMQPLDYAESDPAIVYVTEAGNAEFRATLIEPSATGNYHHDFEDASYLALATGSWLLDDGTRLEVGKASTNAFVGSVSNKSWKRVNFPKPFCANAGRPHPDPIGERGLSLSENENAQGHQDRLRRGDGERRGRHTDLVGADDWLDSHRAWNGIVERAAVRIRQHREDDDPCVQNHQLRKELGG